MEQITFYQLVHSSLLWDASRVRPPPWLAARAVERTNAQRTREQRPKEGRKGQEGPRSRRP